MNDRLVQGARRATALGVTVALLVAASSDGDYVCGESGRALSSPCATDARARDASADCCAGSGDERTARPADTACCEASPGDPSITPGSSTVEPRVESSAPDPATYLAQAPSFGDGDVFRRPAPPGARRSAPTPSLLCRFLC